MTVIKTAATAVMALCISCGVLAATIDVGGVKVEDAVDLQGSKLQLNGAGVRYKAVFKVYTAALYTGKKATATEEFLSAPGPKRISITMQRDIDSNELGKAFTRGFEDNTPKADMVKVITSMIRMGQIFADQKKLLAGENFTIDWIPGVGTVISVKGKPQGEPFKDLDFYNALMRVWLGPNPADFRLKDALLGKAS